MEDASSSPTRERLWLDWLLVAIMGVAALVLRLAAIDRTGLWVDEIFNLNIFESPSLSEALRAVRDDFSKTPLDFALGWVFVHLTGVKLEWMRLWPLLVGVATVPMIYLAGRSLGGRTAGLAGAALISISSFHIIYSLELRFYGLFILTTTMTLWALAMALRNPERWLPPALLAVSLWLAYHTCLFAAFLMVMVGLALALDALTLTLQEGWRGTLRSRGRLWLRLVLFGAVAAALSLPWFLYDTRHEVGIESYGMSVEWTPMRSLYLEILTQLSGQSPWSLFAYALVVLIGVGAALVRRDTLPLAVLLSIPLMLAAQTWILLRGHYWLLPRQCVYLFPLWICLAALGISCVGQWLWRVFESRGSVARAVVALTLGVGCLGVASLHLPGIRAFCTVHTREDWRTAAHLLERLVDPGHDRVAVLGYETYVRPYWPDIDSVREESGTLSAAQIAQARSEGRHVYILIGKSVRREEWMQQQEITQQFPRVPLGLWTHATLVCIPPEVPQPIPHMMDHIRERLDPWEHESGYFMAAFAQLSVVYGHRSNELDELIDRLEATRQPSAYPTLLLAQSLLARNDSERGGRILDEAERLYRIQAASVFAGREYDLETLATIADLRGNSEESERLLQRALWWARWATHGDVGHFEERLAEVGM